MDTHKPQENGSAEMPAEQKTGTCICEYPKVYSGEPDCCLVCLQKLPEPANQQTDELTAGAFRGIRQHFFPKQQRANSELQALAKEIAAFAINERVPEWVRHCYLAEFVEQSRVASVEVKGAEVPQ